MALSETGPLADRREDLLLSIERNEEELREAVHELAEVAETKLYPTEFIRRHPVAWIAGAFCIGLWLGFGGRNGARGNGSTDYYRRSLR